MIKANALLGLSLIVGGCHVIAAQNSGLQGQNDASTAASPHQIAAKDGERYYKLVFRVIAVGDEGTASSSRAYSQVIVADHDGKNGRPSEIRTGDKVPVASGSLTPGVSTQFQYIDVGTEIDTSGATDNDGALQAFITARLSSVGKPNVQNAALNQPVIRQCKWDSRVTVPIGKPTIIFSSDNPSDKGKTELELTATPIH